MLCVWHWRVRVGKHTVFNHSLAHEHPQHTQQQWFIAEAWGLPIEKLWRSHVIPGGTRIPDWLELGFAEPLLHLLDAAVRREGALRALKEAEAEWLEAR